MSVAFQIISPVDGSVYAEREFLTSEQALHGVRLASRAQQDWQHLPLIERLRRLSAAIDRFVAQSEEIAAELAWLMGRPVAQGPGEVRGFEERARYMLDVAPSALADAVPEAKAGFKRYIRREPVGVVLVIAPWNFPYMTAVNTVWPALAAGNAVILKHAQQTAPCAERLAAVLAAAGVPPGVFQPLHMSHATTAAVMQAEAVRQVCFTGSVHGGRAVMRAIARGDGFAAVGLELGGKDPAYVRADAALEDTLGELAEGIFFNSGQSCCSVERIYVHQSIYPELVEGLVREARKLVLGNPLDIGTTLGPLVSREAAVHVRSQIDEAVQQGGRCLINPADWTYDRSGTPYLAPQIVADANHGMRLMTEESFGPLVGVMPVHTDDEAIALMNASEFGLSASIWTRDLDAAERIGERLATGTVFMNRCDYLDAALAWTGVKHSGRGCTLSMLGYAPFVQPKSFHLRTGGADERG